MQEKKNINSITKNSNKNSERKNMKTKDIFEQCSIVKKITSNAPAPCESPLIIEPEFDKLCNVMTIDRTAETPMGDLTSDPEKLEERRALRFEMLKNEMSQTQTVAPFIVWKQKNDIRTIVDGRHSEYKVALQLGLPVSVIDFEFKGLHEARVFVAMHCLNKPHLNAPQRMLLVRQLEEDIRKIAKLHQGKRHDISGKKKIQKFHTTKIMAALSNCGENTLRKFYAVIDEGEEFLQKGKTQEFIERILAGTLSVHNAHNRLLDAKKKKKSKKDFSQDNPDLFPDSTDIDINSDEDTEQIYENPL